MRCIQVWLWSLTLLVGCEANTATKPVKDPVTVITADNGRHELRKGNMVSQVTVVRSKKPVTLSILTDPDSKLVYVANTEHDCARRISTLRFLATYDEDMKPLETSSKVIELDIEAGSLAEAELNLACSKKEALNV